MGIVRGLLERRQRLNQSSGSDAPRWLVELFGGGIPTHSGVVVNENNAMTFPAVFAAVRVLAESVASLPLITYQRIEPRGKTRVVGHPLYSLLHDAPNPEMTAMQFRETQMAHLLLWGNSYAQIITAGGRPVELWPLRPDRMKPKRIMVTNRLAYDYEIKDGGTEEFDQTEILHIRGLAFDGLIGYSPIHLAKQAIGLGMAAEQFGAEWFGNGAHPSGVLEHPNHLTDEAHRRLKDSWNGQHRGPGNANSTAILEEGMKWTAIGIPPGDSQFLETRKFQLQEIARIYRIPPHMLGDLSQATFSNIEQQSLDFVTNSLMPWLQRIEQQIELQLLLPSERKTIFVEHLVNGLLRGDAAARAAFYDAGFDRGWLSPNDIREMENLNPRTDSEGDTYYVPLNMVPAEDAGKVQQGKGSGSEPAPGDDPNQGDPKDPQAGDQQNSLRSARAQQEDRTAEHRRRLARAHLPMFRDAVQRIVGREVADIERLMRKHLTTGNALDFSSAVGDWAMQELQPWVQQRMLPVFETYGHTVAEAVAQEIGADPDQHRTGLDQFIRDYTASFASFHAGDALGQIRGVLAKAQEQGNAPGPAVQQRLEEWHQKQPDKTARRQTSQAGNAVAHALYTLAGVLALRWHNIEPSCAYCQSLEGAVVGVRDFFVQAGMSLQPEGADRPLTPSVNVGHPPLHDGCDCVVIASQ